MAREPLVDAFFAFPDSEEADLEFVARLLDNLNYPVLAVDKDLRVVVSNVQGRDCVAWIKSIGSPQQASGEDEPDEALPRTLTGIIKPLLGRRTHKVIRDVTLIRQPPFMFDVFFSKGRIEGRSVNFIVLMTASSGQRPGAVPVLQRLLDGFQGAAFVMDSQTRFACLNDNFLDAVSYTREELVGRRIIDYNLSEQALAIEKLVETMLRSPAAMYLPAATYTTARKGTFVSPVSTWTMVGRNGKSLGLVVAGGFHSRPAAETVMVERRHVLLEKAADLMGEAIFVTDLDGRILVKNPAADSLLARAEDGAEVNFKTDVPWEIAGTVEDVYRRIVRGADYSSFITGVNLPGRKAIVKVRVFGIRGPEEIVRELVFVCDDVTQEEYLKQLLFEKTRTLASDRDLRDKVLDSVDIPFAVVDRDMTLLVANTAASQRFRLRKEDIIGRKLTEINPSTAASGIASLIEQAFETGEIVRVPEFAHVTRQGLDTTLALSIIPFDLGDRRVCAAVAEAEVTAETERLREKLARSEAVCDAVRGQVSEGIFLVDRDGTFLYANEGAVKGSALPREAIVGKNVSEVMKISDLREDLYKLWEMVRNLEEPYYSDTFVSRSRVHDTRQVIRFSVHPLKDREGKVEQFLAIVHYLSEIRNLEDKVAEYTDRLEALVGQKTEELTASNALLAATVDRVSRVARSREIMTSLTDHDAMVSSFIKQAKAVLGADFLTLVIADRSAVSPANEYHQVGTEPGNRKALSEMLERTVALMMLGRATVEKVWLPSDQMLMGILGAGDLRLALLCTKNEGGFTSIDVNLAHLLCTQLTFALPAARYVGELKRERDRSECMRRIAFRVAGMASVRKAVQAVAEELSHVIEGDRFFWLVNEEGGQVWVMEIFRREGAPGGKSAHTDLRSQAGDAGWLFGDGAIDEIPCEGLRQNESMASGSPAGRARNPECAFLSRDREGIAFPWLRARLSQEGFIDGDSGSLALVPVQLTRHSRSYLCVWREMPQPVANDDVCFMCLAASSVRRVWLEADAASSIRRLETTGETMSELAHDFRYPMAKITDLLRRLASGEISVADSRESADSLLEDVRNLSDLSREFIDLSRPGSDRPEFIDVVQVLESCLSIARDDLRRKSVRVDRQYKDRGPLPPAFASRKDVIRVLINLIANSFEAIEEGGWMKLDAYVDGVGRERPRVVLTFENSGPPVPAEIRQNLFSPFQSSREGGTGLGLFSAKKRANANGGDVALEVDDDGAERFVVWLPAAFE